MQYLSKIWITVIFLLVQTFLCAEVLHVGLNQKFDNLVQALQKVVPGDTILVHPGTYPGGIFSQNLQGTSSKWIWIIAKGEVVFSEGSNGWQLTDAAYLHIKGFIFRKQTSNGFNADDGGTLNTPSHHLVFENCEFTDINATGNNDLLKLSGITNFEIRNCMFRNGSAGGSGIDMVGCHNGLIKNCLFENLGSNSIQAKGGSSNIRIEANLFKNGGQRALNIGGSTGLPFFRPMDAKYEASEIKVYSNVITGSMAAIAFVGAVNSEVVNNTIYLPEKWVIRILQENNDPARFLPCGQNTFRNNLVYRDNRVSTDCNIGGGTDPLSFVFSNNLWFNPQNSNWSGPELPVKDENWIVMNNPLFTNAAKGDFTLQKESPAIGKGYPVMEPVNDFFGNGFELNRSVGAFEGLYQLN